MFDVDLGNLNLADDLDVGAYGIDNPADYQDQLAPAPPKEGNYSLRITGFRQAKDFDTKEPLIEDGKWPVFEIHELEIVEPTEIARKVFLNQKVKTKPFDREGADGPSQASDFMDLIRSFDANARFRGISGENADGTPSGLALLKEYMETGRQTRGRGQWKAFDKAYMDAALDAAGGRNNVSKEEMGRILGKASIKGMRKFPSGKNGYIPEVVGPSGETLRAKFVIARFYPSTEKVKIGV